MDSWRPGADMIPARPASAGTNASATLAAKAQAHTNTQHASFMAVVDIPLLSSFALRAGWVRRVLRLVVERACSFWTHGTAVRPSRTRKTPTKKGLRTVLPLHHIGAVEEKSMGDLPALTRMI